MIRYKPLRIEQEVDAAKTDKERQELIRGYWESLRSSPGFPLLVKILRDLEMDALNALHRNTSERLATYSIAKIHCVDFIRRCLAPPLPPDDDVWETEVEEDFMHESPE